jgi:protein-disulfide isomerase
MSARFWAIIGIIIVVFVGILAFSNKDENGGAAGQTTNHVRGNTSSKVKLVEYGDFQCPVCGSYYPVVTQVLSAYQDKIAFQFRNLPLSQAHQHAFAAARAAEAADKQGKFWDMYDTLFQNQTAWSQLPSVQPQFEQYAKQLGLNVTKFKTDFASSSVNALINNDVAAFKRTGAAMATPTFFLNGKKVEPSQLTDEAKRPSFEKFSAVLDKAL